MATMTLIDRGTGEARSFHIDAVDGKTILPIVRSNVAKESSMATDEASHYAALNREDMTMRRSTMAKR
jgi:transposase-like protein